MKKLRILIADDHDLVRYGIKSLLETQSEWVVCGEAVTGQEAVRKTAQLKPDVVVLDINMPELNGLEVSRQILKKAPETEILILTMDESPALMRELINLGVHGYVFKSDFGGDLIPAVEALSKHMHFLTTKGIQMMYQNLQQSPTGGKSQGSKLLTGRQREVVRLLAGGKSNKEAASALGISVKTVESHRSNIMLRLNLKSFSDLVRYALREKIITD